MYESGPEDMKKELVSLLVQQLVEGNENNQLKLILKKKKKLREKRVFSHEPLPDTYRAVAV